MDDHRGECGAPAAGALPRRTLLIRAARRHLRERQWAEAEQTLEPLLAKARADAEALFLMALACEAQGSLTRAGQYVKRSLAAAEHPDALLLQAGLERLIGATDSAIALCERVLQLRAGDRRAWIIKAGALEEAGRFEEARAILEPLVTRAESAGNLELGYEWAKILIHDRRYDESIALLDDLIRDERTTPAMRRVQLHLKAKACDRLQDYGGAFEAATAANAIGELEFDPDLYRHQVGTLMEVWSAEDLPRFPLSTCDSELPVFVAGMPRSGTSLIDQVIDAHPRAAGVGELSDIEAFALELSRAYDPERTPPACFGRYDSRRFTREADKYVRTVRKLSPPQTQRVVNKALGNNKLVGLISRMFPRTRIIHAVRDPRDVAVSCCMGGFNNAMHPWTTRVEWVAQAWEQSVRMMEHWKRVLDVPILDVHYEALVADPQGQFRRIIEFLGLEWDDACLSFHKTRRTVRTLSYDQVNRPVYTTSVGRHARYATFLQGVDFPEYSVERER